LSYRNCGQLVRTDRSTSLVGALEETLDGTYAKPNIRSKIRKVFPRKIDFFSFIFKALLVYPA
jgi:hypothetical protein